MELLLAYILETSYNNMLKQLIEKLRLGSCKTTVVDKNNPSKESNKRGLE